MDMMPTILFVMFILLLFSGERDVRANPSFCETAEARVRHTWWGQATGRGNRLLAGVRFGKR
jgi:hypothetical protein